MALAKSSLRAAIPSKISARIVFLSSRVKELAFENAFLAASTARLTSSSLPATTKPISSSVAGFINAIFSVPFGVTNSPLI